MPSLEQIIKELHGAEATYVESVPVREIFNKIPVWQGTVEVFDLKGHPQATRCYAWSYEEGGKRKAVTILGIPPINSPEAAVKVAVANEARKTVPKK